MVERVDKVVLPGDILTDLSESEISSKIIIGPGLRQEADEIIVSKPGLLRLKKPNVYWVDCQQKRYVPERGDTVIGVVTAKAGDAFRVDVGGSELATLSYLGFEGATKRNRPDVKVGDIINTKFLVANKDMEPELVCIDSQGRSSGMGVIGRDGGYMFQCSLNLVRKLLSPECVLMKLLGRTMPFELAAGMNGRLWIKARSPKQTIFIANAIYASEYMLNEQIKAMCSKLGNVSIGT
ncbi:hypothetical protein ScPMuIL_000794 [Solemya velum]